jgi:hypothetical protein
MKAFFAELFPHHPRARHGLDNEAGLETTLQCPD